MSVHFGEGRFTFTCNECGTSKVVHADTFEEAWGMLKTQDKWGAYKHRGEFQHTCPDCD